MRRALLAVAVALAWNCREPVAVQPEASPPPAASLFSWPDVSGLFVNCTPLPADSATALVGPAGGIVRVGPHTLSIPAGALDTAVTITAVAPSDTLRRVRLRPEGLTFAEPAWLTLSYAQCGIAGSLLPKRIAYTSDAFEILSYLLSFDNWFSRTVTGRLDHFSDYVVAW